MRQKSKTPHQLGLSGKSFRPGSFKRAGHLRTISTLVAGLSLATVAASAATFIQGYLNYEYYPGAVRDDVNAGTAVPSTGGTVVGSDKGGKASVFESGTNFADNYANKFSGYFVPPTTGDYVFFIAGDDDSDLFLSTDATAANKKLIAQEAGWSAVRSYTAIGGGSTPEDKRSDKFAGSQWPGADPTAGNKITLTAGTKYYIEATHHEGGGGDNLAVTFKLASEPDPKSGDAPRLVGAVIGSDFDPAPPASTVSIKVPPVGGTFYTGQPLVMFAVADTTSTYPVIYQWRKNGANIVGAGESTFRVSSASTNDAGSYDVVLSVPGPTGLISVTSAPPVNVTVQNIAEVFQTGVLRYDYFPGNTRVPVEALGPGGGSTAGATLGSDRSGFHTIFESGVNFADNYANRFAGYFIPPSTGDYIFFVAGDDDSDLFLSTDDNPANKKLIAQEVSWSNNRQWNTGGGGSSTTEGKRSDMFDGTQWPGGVGAAIHLTAGQKYYLEGVHHEGGGGDDFGATYRLASEAESLTADGTASRLTGNVIGANVPQIMSIAAGAPDGGKFTFTITDAGTSVLDPATTKLVYDGQVVVPTASPKNGAATAYTYTFPTRFPQLTTHYFTIQATDTKGQPVTTGGQYTLPAKWWPDADLVGPAVAEKKINSRFIFNVHNAAAADPSALVQITGLQNIFNILKQSGTPGFANGTGTNFIGTVIDSPTDVINWAGGGFFGNNLPYPDAVTADAGWTAEDFINLNIMNLVIPEESDYTFGVHSDDGFAMRIRGGVTVSVAGNGQLDPVDPEAVVHPGDTGDSNTRAVYHLKKGTYRVEMFWWERGGGDNGEFYAAKGAFVNDGDTQTWRLVGDPTPSQELTLLGVDATGWTVISSDPGGDTITDWTVANADLAATGGGAKTYDRLFVGDPDSNAGVDPFPKNTPAGDDNFAMKANATLVVPEDGTYLIGFNTDDGGYVKIAGKTFTAIVQNNTETATPPGSVINGDTVICDCLTGDSGTLATITLTKGNYPIEFGQYEQGGGAFLAGRGAKQPANPVTTSDIPVLTKGAAGTKVQTVAALQATSAAADGGSGGGGGTGAKLTITKNGNNITITSDKAGTVQSKDTLGAGAWTNVGAAPQTVPITGTTKFFRVQGQ